MTPEELELLRTTAKAIQRLLRTMFPSCPEAQGIAWDLEYHLSVAAPVVEE